MTFIVNGKLKSLEVHHREGYVSRLLGAVSHSIFPRGWLELGGGSEAGLALGKKA
jgi:hypothetical protein